MKELKVFEYKSFNKYKGLIGEKTPRSIYFKTRFGLHTFFLLFPIDIVVLNNNHQIVRLKEKLSPYSIFLWNPFYYHVLELPEGTITKMNLKLGETVTLNFKI